MDTIFEKAAELRQQGRYSESDLLLIPLLDGAGAAKAHLLLAWNRDAQGHEQDAIPHYQEALKGSLSEEDSFDALLGLASSLRCLGEYEQAEIYFKKGRLAFPDRVELLPFHAMNLHNLGQSKEAVSLLLSTLLDHSDNEKLLAYKSAIALYADDLDKVWY